MIADKKSNKSKVAPSPADEPRTKGNDEFDNKRKMIREKIKANRVNYVIKDLPIY
jgi:hypothetical protein